MLVHWKVSTWLILFFFLCSLSVSALEPIGSKTILPGGLSVDLRRHFDVGNATDSFVQVSTTMGNFTLELFRDTAPKNVENFLSYIKSGSYQNTVFHRSVPGFIIQTGGFTVGADLPAIEAKPPVVNEYQRSNLRGTVAMAKLDGNPNSATSQWFVNLADNSQNLNNQNGGFTVFGQVLDRGMDVWDAIAGLKRYDLGGAFTDLPLQNVSDGQTSVQLSNLVSITKIQASPFYAYSSNPSAFSVAVEGWRLKIIPGVSATQFAQITIVTKNLQGQATQVSFSVELGGSRTFSGFLNGRPIPQFASLSVSRSGQLTGVLENGNSTSRFVGKLAWQSTANQTIKLSGNETLVLNPNSQPGKIATQWISSNNSTASGYLEPQVNPSNEMPNLQNFAVNSLLIRDLQGSTGCGFAKLLVQKTGAVSVIGTLPDGTPFSKSTVLRTPDASEVNSIPVAIYWRGKTPSYLAGTLSMGTIPGLPYLSGNLSWTQPTNPSRPVGSGKGPFNLDVMGSRWSPPVSLNALSGAVGNRTFTLELNFPKSDDFGLDGTWPVSNTPKLTAGSQFANLTFDPAPGYFNGTFRKSTAIPFVGFRGLLLAQPLVLQNGVLLHGGGWLPEGNATGPVWILSRP